MELRCRTVGDPIPTNKWFLNGREEAWMSRQNSLVSNTAISAFADSDTIFHSGSQGEGLVIREADPENADGNYTCYTENKLGSDSATFQVHVQVPPEPANLHILQTSSTTITSRWRITNSGFSPINRIVLNYKMTYGEWAEKEVRILKSWL